MRLQLSGAPEVAAPADFVWGQILDPAVVASCAPGVEGVEARGENQYAVTAKFGAGAVSLRFTLDVVISDLDPPRSAKMTVSGKAPGSAVKAENSLRLEPADGKTRLSWETSVEVFGTLASLGARVMQGAVRSQAEKFWNRFAETIGTAWVARGGAAGGH